MGVNKSIKEKRVVTGTVAAGTYREDYEAEMAPNATLKGFQFADKMQMVCPATAPETGNEGATLNTVTKSGNVLTNGWYKVHPQETSFGAKMMFENVGASASVLYGLGLRARTAIAGARAVGFNVSASANIAASGQLMGGEFYLQNAGAYTIADPTGLPSTALHVKSWLAAACTDAASALWIDDESSVLATGGQYMVNITMNGSVEIDKVFHIYGGDPGADTFIDFDTCDQGAGAFVVATAAGGATRSHKIKCTVNGSTAGYMSLYTD
jgi:hypothetical protein